MRDEKVRRHATATIACRLFAAGRRVRADIRDLRSEHINPEAGWSRDQPATGAASVVVQLGHLVPIDRADRMNPFAAVAIGAGRHDRLLGQAELAGVERAADA